MTYIIEITYLCEGNHAPLIEAITKFDDCCIHVKSVEELGDNYEIKGFKPLDLDPWQNPKQEIDSYLKMVDSALGEYTHTVSSDN